MTIYELLAKYRAEAHDQRDKGDKFERLMRAYLLTERGYAEKLKHVWKWEDFFAKRHFGGADVGIDLVAETVHGEYWAIQCKFYARHQHIAKAEVDTFLATAGRSFPDRDHRDVRFVYCLFISTSSELSHHTQNALATQNPPSGFLSLGQIAQASVNWAKLENEIHGNAARLAKKELRPHQTTALQKTIAHFAQPDTDRGKLIMACGTGKTFNSLRIAETQTDGQGLVLFLVPSIALLGQTLREWTANSVEEIEAICICSDAAVNRVSSKKVNESDQVMDNLVTLAMPASTDVEDILRQFARARGRKKPGMTVVFSTYQSIGVIAAAQKRMVDMNLGYGEFDLIVCDEAHRTSGLKMPDLDESAFTRVHDNDFLKAKKRLYMTATPKLYSEESKAKAKEGDVALWSMDNTEYYGEEIHRIGFGEAVEMGLLTDYKVLILTISDKDVPPAVLKMIADNKEEITTDDASKLIGCINALSKQMIGADAELTAEDKMPMKRAVAFCQSIKDSKRINSVFNETAEIYKKGIDAEDASKTVKLNSKHIDGTMGAPERDEMINWLKEDAPDGECRVLTNVRCLSEGVDVPSLDAVMFLSAKNSQIEVVQSVGRVMRKAEGKRYGYIIIPVVVAADVAADKALDKNEKFKVVWTVLNALRAHDDRFNAIINKIDLNKNRPSQIAVVAVGAQVQPDPADYGDDKEHFDGTIKAADAINYATREAINQQLAFDFEGMQNVIFARLVKNVGEKHYWENWAKDVGAIASRQVERLAKLISNNETHANAFANFLLGLQKNINPGINTQQAIDMLSQHIITRPVFEALFEDYSFVSKNPISISMQAMLDLLEEEALEKDLETLQRFYNSVKRKAAGIDNAEGKQRIIIELYDKFFKAAFPKLVEQLGIVYTPVEVVDFIIHSVNDVLKAEFGRSLSDENVHILDPFTGTGTFITRLLQSGLIRLEDLERKYKHEIHANEIVLLAYYIAAVNIENAYHDAMEAKGYSPFEGICLTDTFQLGEADGDWTTLKEMYPQNSDRVEKQKGAPMRVIMGNPPYSIGQKSANDNAQNQKYKNLEARIETTYVKESNASALKSLYDSYIKAFRWSADRLDPNVGGIICFVSNGGWLGSNSSDGFRKVLHKEFSSIYVYDLRGNQRTNGELSRKEGGKIFGSGSRTPVAITLLVKKPNSAGALAKIFYKDIGDYLKQDEKLSIIKATKTILNPNMGLAPINPNVEGDWINVRNGAFEQFIPIEPVDRSKIDGNSFFNAYSLGVGSNRDAFVYNSSLLQLRKSINNIITFYNLTRETFSLESKTNSTIKIESLLVYDPTKLNWTDSVIGDVKRNFTYLYDVECERVSSYRPFFKQNLYFSKYLNHRRFQIPRLFPEYDSANLVICLAAPGGSKDLSVLIQNSIPDLHYIGDTQCFPLYYYEEVINQSLGLFDKDAPNQYVRRDAISNWIWAKAKEQYGERVTKEDIFYYVYGFLHSPEYRATFAADFKKMLPRIPLVKNPKDFWAFSKAGRALAALHIDYEAVPPSPGVTILGPGVANGYFIVEKMRFAGKKGDADYKSAIVLNPQITVGNIPAEAYSYVVNGKSAIEWIMERYAITTHKESQITNNPNDWATEVGNPRYILDLLLSIINVSLQTVAIVKGLPTLDFESGGEV